uniref:Flap endonuclease GEN n=1 Tax=Drosophila pseudoobscura pseudoobscura TaxID=46245 RepID=GEN_DROPS|nr:RecName: Full=Flap endonuclease GEN; AltName: Full=Flap structure-specific endonuclease GEN; AltName: Full=Xpg-like endonuclease [Drosophila pseudoobscura pseudoobscura]
MGVKELWTVLTPHAERKPINELRGKKVAIDLAGWVCESLNVVDYFVHPRHHLKNLFFRTCYLIWEQVTPVFVLEGVAPKLKGQVIAKRNELQFRGVRPKDAATGTQTAAKVDKGRTRFNHVLKQCETLLLSMGIQCVQGPGEAEAYAAFLNKHGLVDGVISQDSDCFAYGAIRVYRNFSVSTQGAQAAAGGAVDIYDMREITSRMDFGQHKIIVMALLCGCDYCPDGIGGIGKDGVLKLFNKYKESEILDRLRNWRAETDKYNALEMRVDDKSICSNCGHIGRTQSHTKSGCSVCRTKRGCDKTLWKEQRLSIKAELILRRKALLAPEFPNEEIISEFLSEPPTIPNLNLGWRQPNLVKFIKQIGHLLQWPEIYCFQKFFPILTRWQVQQAARTNAIGRVELVQPVDIIKKRTVKGVASLELRWQDPSGSFQGLIPDKQISEFELEHPKGIEELYYTVEPLDMLEAAYPDLVASFLKSKEKPPKKATRKKKTDPLSAIENIPETLDKQKANPAKPKRVVKKKKAPTEQAQPSLQQFLRREKIGGTPVKDSLPQMAQLPQQCSTPITKFLPSDLESDCDAVEFDMSDVVNGIISNPNARPTVTRHEGRQLHYEALSDDLSMRLAQLSLRKDELQEEPLPPVAEHKRDLSLVEHLPQSKRLSLDDSFDLLVKGDLKKVPHLIQPIRTPVDRFKHQHRISEHLPQPAVEPAANVSYFFNQSSDNADAFEQLMNSSLGIQEQAEEDEEEEDDLVVISD